MTQPLLNHIYPFLIDSLHSPARAEKLKQLLREALASVEGVQTIETDIERRLLTLSSSVPLEMSALKKRLVPEGFHLRVHEPRASRTPTTMDVCIKGMTCRSCELTIERAWKKLDKISAVKVDASRGTARLHVSGTPPSIDTLQVALDADKYRVLRDGKAAVTNVSKPSALQLAGLFGLVP